MSCSVCDDGKGGSKYPYYGPAPKGISCSESTLEEKYTFHFYEDPHNPGYGSYLQCPQCTAGAFSGAKIAKFYLIDLISIVDRKNKNDL